MTIVGLHSSHLFISFNSYRLWFTLSFIKRKLMDFFSLMKIYTEAPLDSLNNKLIHLKWKL